MIAFLLAIKFSKKIKKSVVIAHNSIIAEGIELKNIIEGFKVITIGGYQNYFIK